MRASTINAAYALRQERHTGSIEPGKRADLVILDRNQIRQATVRHTHGPSGD
ncbi:amidohydrolase family protein [Nonomuraea sp. NPDC050394]|uniref:amidohydrolase family protein n=1 Tax=Nonomuraea sp. NPDC050394 TaxID=3364363 RepID=UPI0037A91620